MQRVLFGITLLFCWVCWISPIFAEDTLAPLSPSASVEGGRLDVNATLVMMKYVYQKYGKQVPIEVNELIETDMPELFIFDINVEGVRYMVGIFENEVAAAAQIKNDRKISCIDRYHLKL